MILYRGKVHLVLKTSLHGYRINGGHIAGIDRPMLEQLQMRATELLPGLKDLMKKWLVYQAGDAKIGGQIEVF